VDFIHRIENAVRDLNGVLANHGIEYVIAEGPREAVEIVDNIDTGLLHSVHTGCVREFISTTAYVKDVGVSQRLTSRFGWFG
jgi:hypothetical protein